MRKYVIMGVPGSGKSLQASWLARDLDLVHISVGDIFRWNVQQHTKMGADVRRIMAAGELVGDDLAEKVTAQRLADHDWNYGFIIDGFPRNARQAEFFLESYDIDAVIHLDLPDAEVRRRVLARRLCSGCGMDYNLIEGRPREEGKCDVCGGTLVTREDDTEDALVVRLRDYHEKTDPRARDLRAQGVRPAHRRHQGQGRGPEGDPGSARAARAHAGARRPAVSPAAPVPRTPGRRTPAACGSPPQGSGVEAPCGS
jgi:adenylate kinase